MRRLNFHENIHDENSIIRTSKPPSFCTCADGIQPILVPRKGSKLWERECISLEVMSRGLEWTNQTKERQIRTKEVHLLSHSPEPEV